MAQSGYTPLLIYGSGTASNVPLAANLTSSALGAELALNYADGKLYFKNSSGVVTLLASSTATGGSFTSITDSGNLTFTGTGNRITADFSNATALNKVMFQTSTANSTTSVEFIPNGTGASSSLVLSTNSDPTNEPFFQLFSGSTEARLAASGRGTFSYLPMTFYTGGSERARIDTSGNVGIGTTSPATNLNISSASAATGGDGLQYVQTTYTGTGTVNSGYTAKNYYGTSQFFQWNNNGTRLGNRIITNSGGGALVFTYGNDSEGMRIDSSGNVGIGTSSPSKKLEVYATSNSLQIESIVRNDQAGTGVAAIGFNVSSTAASETTSTKAGIGLVRSSSYGVGSLCFYVNGTTSAGDFTTADERMRIDSSGNLLVGATVNNVFDQISGARPLLVQKSDTSTTIAGSTASITISNGDTTTNNTAQINFAAITGASTNQYSAATISAVFGARTNGQYPAGQLAFSTSATGNAAPTERMRIDSSGNVGIGITSPSTYGRLAVNVPTSGNGVFSINNSVGGGGGAQASFYYQSFKFAYMDATLENGTPGTEAGRLVFATSTGGTLTERMRIDSSGNVSVGATSVFAGVKFYIAGVAGASNPNGILNVASTTTGDTAYPVAQFSKFDATTNTSAVLIRFAISNNTAGQGQINANGASAAAFGSFSDRRLKENITDLPSQLANIMALRPVEFDYIESEGGGHQLGFIAQEVKEIYPDLVGEREDGMYTLSDMNKNDARLIKCIQEQQALITALTARITALESK